jgi:alcohol dehydrogenase YqhD (iron-dependent ADH family)
LRLTIEQAEAVMRIAHNPDFKKVMDAINIYRHEAIEFSLYGPGDLADVNRGIARGVTEIMRGIGKAHDIVKPRG